MKRVLLIILISFLFIQQAYSLQVSPSSWVVELRPGEIALKTFEVINNYNTTENVTIYDSGTISSWLWEEPNSFSLEPFSSNTFNSILVVPQGQLYGNYSGTINVNNISIPVNVNIRKWYWERTDWYVDNIKLTINPTKYVIIIRNVSMGIDIEIKKDNSTIESGQFNIGDSREYDEMYFQIIDRYAGQVRLLIKTIYSTSSITVTQSQQQENEGGSSGNFGFYTTQYGNKFYRNVVTKETFTLRNGLNENVDLKSINYEGTIITDIGRQPIRIEDWTLTQMSPGSEKNFIVTIDTRGLELGEWRPTLTVTGLTSSGKIVSSSISLLIWVVGSAIAPTYGQSDIKITAPQSVNQNQEFNIIIENLPEGGTVWMSPNQNVIGKNVTKLDSKWIWTGYINSTESQQIEISIMQYGGILKTYKLNIAVGSISPSNITVEYYPTMPKSGNLLTFSVTPSDATIKITVYEGDIIVNKFIYTAPFVVTAGKRYYYEISKEGYTTISGNIEVPLKNIEIVINPQNPTPTDKIMIEARSEGGIAQNVKINVDGRDYTASSTIVTLSEGIHTITVSGEGYNTATTQINVLRALEILSGPTGDVGVGWIVNITFNRPTSYEIRLNGEIVQREDNVNSFGFTPQSEGIYEVWAEGKLVTQFKAVPGLFSIPDINSALPIIIIIFIGIGIVLTLRRKKKGKIGFSPFTEPGPIEVT